MNLIMCVFQKIFPKMFSIYVTLKTIRIFFSIFVKEIKNKIS